MGTLKRIALPPEHGSWGLTFEPLTLALLVAFSTQGAMLYLGAALAFLAHQPVRIILTGKNEKRLAWLFLMVYGAPAFLLFTAVFFTSEYNELLPLMMAILIMFFYLVAEYFHLHRALLTEIMASVAIGLIALSIVLSKGWNGSLAIPFLALIYLRSLNATLYIHFRLKLERKQPFSRFWAQFWQVLTLFIVILLLSYKAIPLLAAVSVMVLVLRGIWGLSAYRKPLNVKQIGIREFIYGFQFVVLSAVGYLFYF